MYKRMCNDLERAIKAAKRQCSHKLDDQFNEKDDTLNNFYSCFDKVNTEPCRLTREIDSEAAALQVSQSDASKTFTQVQARKAAGLH